MRLEKVFSPARAQRMMALALSSIIYHLSFSPAGAQSYSKYIQAVDEYRPAPGQFINTMPEYEAGDTEADMVRKCTAYLADDERSAVCLGGYGGYITFHFDHPIANISGQRDLMITGNSFASTKNPDVAGGNSEPGIVMVSKDENQNGLPDDPWYELSGSADADSAGKVVYDYQITYTRRPMQSIPWTDSQGRQGVIARNAYHDQEYYPLWMDDETLTFRGTLLPTNMTFRNGEFLLMFLREGYVDNKPNSDAEANSFDISWAVDGQRQPVALDYIDFVRVYTAVNQGAGTIGETSTEVTGAEDLHLEASVEAWHERTTGISSPRPSALSPQPSALAPLTSMDGRRVAMPHRGLYIREGKKVLFK